jgi:hypothetical protein
VAYGEGPTFDGMGNIVASNTENLKADVRPNIKMISEQYTTISKLQSRLAKLEKALEEVHVILDDIASELGINLAVKVAKKGTAIAAAALDTKD